MSEEKIAMGSFTDVANAPCAWLAELFLSVTITTAATASQGPGAGPGAASASTQLTMAVIIYGGVALILAASLIGALKRKFAKR